MNERLKAILGRFVDLRTPQKRDADFWRAQREEAQLKAQYSTKKISLQEYNDGLEILDQNPNYHHDLRRAGKKLGTP